MADSTSAKEDLEELERDEPAERTEEEEFEIFAEVETEPDELPDPEERKRYAEFLKTYELERAKQKLAQHKQS